MKTTRLLTLLIVSLLSLPMIAHAKPSEELAGELGKYVEAARAEDNPRAAMYALMAKGQLEGRSAAKELTEQAEDADAWVRLGATMGLVLAGAPGAHEALAAELAEDSQLYIKLAEVVRILPAADQAKALKVLLESAEPAQQRDVFRYLAEQNGAVYQILEDSLTSSAEETRKLAVDAAIATAKSEAGALAERMLGSKDEGVRADAVKLAAALANRSGGGETGIKALEVAIKSNTSAVATQAARELVRFQNTTGVKYLADSIAELDEDADKISTAQYLLAHEARVSAKLAADLIAAEDPKLQTLGYQFGAASGDAEILSKLLEMYSSTHFDERLIALSALGKTGAKQAVAPLSQGLFEGTKEIRLGAARALGELGDAGALDSLQKVITTERDPEIKIAALEAVGSIKSPKSLQILRFQTTAREPDIKRVVVRGIRQIGDKEGVKALTVLRNDRDLKVQWEVFLTALELSPASASADMSRQLRNPPEGFIDDVVALPEATRKKVLTHLLRGASQTARAEALDVVLGAEDEATLKFIRELVVDKKVDADTRRALLEALAAKQGPKDKALFEKIGRDDDAPDDLRYAAITTLIAYGTKDLGATFRGLLGSQDPIIKAQATLGLALVS